MQKISISYRVFFFAIFQPADFKFLFCNIEKTMKTFALSSIKLVFHRRKCLVSKPQKHRDKAGNSLHMSSFKHSTATFVNTTNHKSNYQ